MGRRIVSLDNGYTVESADANNVVKRSGTLYYDTKAEADADTDKVNWAAGTKCYTAAKNVGILNSNGTWDWWK